MCIYTTVQEFEAGKILGFLKEIVRAVFISSKIVNYNTIL